MPEASAAEETSLPRELWRSAGPLEAAVLCHPFVRGLGDGTLPPDRYRFYLLQDWLFLREYVRVLALAAAAAPGLEEQRRLVRLLQATLDQEMDLHRRTAALEGLGAEDLDQGRPAPFTFAYTRHLLSTARGGTLGEIVAGLLPCQWGYAVIGRHLAARGPSPVARYQEWIQAYAGEAYQGTARWMWDLAAGLGRGMGAAERARAGEAFAYSFQLEYAFWDGCWRRQTWPVCGGD